MKQFLIIFIFLILSNASAYSMSFEDAENYIDVREFKKALETLKSINPKNIDENPPAR